MITTIFAWAFVVIGLLFIILVVVKNYQDENAEFFGKLLAYALVSAFIWGLCKLI